jgi:hypothetical protein
MSDAYMFLKLLRCSYKTFVYLMSRGIYKLILSEIEDY